MMFFFFFLIMVPSSFASAGDIDFFVFVFFEFIELVNIFFDSIYCIYVHQWFWQFV